MVQKIKKMKLAREVIAVLLVTLLFKFQPDAVNFNFTLFTSLIFISTIPGDKDDNFWKKNFSLPAITFYVVTLLLMFKLIEVLTIDYIITIGALTNVKAVKTIISNRLNKIDKKNVNKEDETLIG